MKRCRVNVASKGSFKLGMPRVHSLLDSSVSDIVVDLKMSIVKPLGAQWLMETYDYIWQSPKSLKMV